MKVGTKVLLTFVGRLRSTLTKQLMKLEIVDQLISNIIIYNISYAIIII